MKRILVTGAAGFIGYHLCLRLLESGNSVIGYDNFISGQRRHIDRLQGFENFEFREWDITRPFKVAAEEIYNLACPASPLDYQKYPLETLSTNFLGALNVLEVARENGAKILQTSTSEVYGDPLVHPQPETYFGNVNPMGVRSCYDEGKRVAETLFFEHHRQYGTPVRIVRIFNTYGPNMRQKDGRVISNFINQALRGEDITIYGDGLQTRSFCYISDLLEGLIDIMDQSGDFPGPVNIGNPEEVTVKQLAALVCELAGSKSRLSFLPGAEDDPRLRKPDITLIKEILQWQPKVGIREGLQKTIDYYAGIRDEEDRDIAAADAV